jgi:hypothetical protein
VNDATTGGATIITTGDNADGILAQSIGGGGGIGGGFQAAAEDYSTTVAAPFSLNVGVGGAGGAGGNGGTVTVTNGAAIDTVGSDAIGIFAQSIGGGGGTGGNGGVPGSPLDILTGFTLGVGGSGGASGNGGQVSITNTGAITTVGEGADAIQAQSVGGGGGEAGNGFLSTLTNGHFSLGGGGNGSGGTVTITNSAELATAGAGAFGIFAQSVGGGGGAVGDLTQGIDKGTNIFGARLGGGNNGDVGNGGDVTVSSTGDIVTYGVGAEGILAQSVGGGGGLLGAWIDQSNNVLVGASGLTDDNRGTGGTVSVSEIGLISTANNYADGVFAESLGGYNCTGGSVTVDLTGAIVSPSRGSDGIYAESAGYSGGNAINVTIHANSSVIGGSGQGFNPDGSNNIGAGIYLVGGAQLNQNGGNRIDNYGAISDTGGIAVLTMMGPATTGNGGTTTAAYGYTTLINESAGVIGGAIQIARGALINQGAIDISALNAFAGNSHIGGDATNTGSLTVETGTFTIDGVYTQTGDAAATMVVGGKLAGNGFVIGGGTVHDGATVFANGSYKQTGGTLVLDVAADPTGGFDVGSLYATGSLDIENTDIVIDFVGGVDAQAFIKAGLLDLDTFFKDGSSSTLAQEGALAHDFKNDTFSVVGATGIGIIGFDAATGALMTSSTGGDPGARPPSAPSLTLSGAEIYDVVGPSTANVAFASGSAATLILSDSRGFHGTVAGLAPHNAIDLVDLAFTGNSSATSFASAGAAGGTLAVTEGGTTINLALLGNYMAASFAAASDGHGGTLITEQPQVAVNQLTQPVHLAA